MRKNHAQKILTGTNMTACNVKYTVQKRDVELMLFKKYWYDFIKFSFREKKPDCNLVAAVNRNEANVLPWRDMEGGYRVINILASAPIAGKSDDAG